MKALKFPDTIKDSPSLALLINCFLVFLKKKKINSKWYHLIYSMSLSDQKSCWSQTSKEVSNFFSNTISVKYFTSISPTCHNAQIYNTRSLGAPRLLLYYEVGMSLLKPICLPSWFARGVRPEGKYKFELKEQITTFYQNFMIFFSEILFPWQYGV